MRNKFNNGIFEISNFVIEDFSDNIKNFYKYLTNLNKDVNRKFKLPKKDYKIDMSLLDTIDYDILLLIPNGCYKFLNLFVTESNFKKIMFWEFHIDKTKPSTHKIFEKNLNNKKVLIVDSVYSGKTLSMLKRHIEELGGIPILLGLYPKSKSVINILDYALILNKLYKREELNINDENMFINIYINTIKKLGDKIDKRTTNKI